MIVRVTCEDCGVEIREGYLKKHKGSKVCSERQKLSGLQRKL